MQELHGTALLFDHCHTLNEPLLLFGSACCVSWRAMAASHAFPCHQRKKPVEKKTGNRKIIAFRFFVFYTFRYDMYMGLHLCVHCGSLYWEMLVDTIEHIIAGVLTVIVCSQEPLRFVQSFTHVSILGVTLGATLGGNFGR